MATVADSFWGKVLLLILDKLVIGAIIALAFFFYERHKTEENRKYEESRAEIQRDYEERRTEIQLEFERARLIKEILPIIQDSRTSPITSGYLLRSAILTNSLGGAAAFRISRDFLYGKLSEDRYKELVSESLPSSITAFANQGVRIAREWHSALGGFPLLDVKFNPLNDKEYFPEGTSHFITEARLLRDLLYDNLPAFENFESSELSKKNKVRDSLFGLFVLFQTTDLQKARTLSHQSDDVLQLVGMVVRAWQTGGNDEEAEEHLEAQFRSVGDSKNLLQRAFVLVALFRWISAQDGGLQSPAFARVLAKIAVGDLPGGDNDAANRADMFWLRWNAAEALDLAKDQAVGAVPAIVQFLHSFREELAMANGQEALREISIRFQSGKIVRRLVSVLGNIGSEEARRPLQALLSLADGVLRHFPFLESDLRRALK